MGRRILHRNYPLFQPGVHLYRLGDDGYVRKKRINLWWLVNKSVVSTLSSPTAARHRHETDY